MSKKVGIAGTGALGNAVVRALLDGIPGLTLTAASDLAPNPDFDIPYVDFDSLTGNCDLIVECLPPAAVPQLAQLTFKRNKDLVLISSCALLMFPEILETHKRSKSRVFVPSGALAGIDGVTALKQIGIESARIASTKRPRGFEGAPFIVQNQIDLAAITEKTCLFSGNAAEAAKGFPANVNVAATLSLAGIGPGKTQVEIWADPAAKGNTHEIEVKGRFSTIHASVSNEPDPSNPKSSMLAAQSIIALLKNMTEPLVVI